MAEGSINQDADAGVVLMSFVYTLFAVIFFIVLTPPSMPPSEVIPQAFFANLFARFLLGLFILRDFKRLHESDTVKGRRDIFFWMMDTIAFFIMLIVIITDIYLYDRIGYLYLFYAVPALVILGIAPMMRFLKIKGQSKEQ